MREPKVPYWILYIDDEIDHCRMVGDFFTSRGLDVMFAFNGKMAQEILRQQTPNLIFLDLRMPEMHGKDFLRYLTHQRITIPVFVITGYPEDITDLEEEAFEIKGFFTKPVKLEELFEETKKLLKIK
jgi:two-component system response regulator (stage 0 sporulation protein F)